MHLFHHHQDPGSSESNRLYKYTNLINHQIKVKSLKKWLVSNRIKNRIVFFYCMFSVSGYHRVWFVHMHSDLLGPGPIETGELARGIMS